jgi:hypothetical protein
MSGRPDVPWDSENDVLQEIETSVKKIRHGDFVVVDFDSEQKRIRVVADFEDLSTISLGSVIISYKELSEAFYESQCL